MGVFVTINRYDLSTTVGVCFNAFGRVSHYFLGLGWFYVLWRAFLYFFYITLKSVYFR